MSIGHSDELADETVQVGNTLEESAEQWLATRSTAAMSRTAEQMWTDLAELGWFHTIAAECDDGLALPPATLIGLVRAAGRHLLAGPVLEHVFVAPWLLDQLGDDSARAMLRPALTGQRRLALAEPCSAPPHLDPPRVDARGRISGTVRLVPHAADADVLVIVTPGPSPQIHLVDASTSGVSIRRREPLSAVHPVADVQFAQVPVVTVAVTTAVLDEFYAWLRLLSAAWFTGVAEEALRLTASYVDGRIQFGRAVGGYQAVQHVVADMTVDVHTMANLVSFVAARMSSGDLRPSLEDGIAAKAFTAERCLAVCESALQMHGGIGFTTDYPLHRFYTAALAMQCVYGRPEELYLELGQRSLSQLQNEKVET